jgi:hypothetical protein
MATKVQIKKLLQAKEKKLNKIYMNVIQLSWMKGNLEQ